MRISLFLPLLGLILSPLLPQLASAGESIPSYESARQALEAERTKQSDGPKISAEDRAIMQRSSKDLAQRMSNPGPAEGSKAPDFTLPNAFGKSVNLYHQLEKGPVVLVFYRGAWCPYCNLQLHTLRKALPQFEQRGAQLITVTPQRPDKSLEQIKKDGYPFEILSDLDSSVMKAYNLYFEVPEDLVDVYKRNFDLDLADYNGKGRYVLPVPATLIIDSDGEIHTSVADVNYKKRMEPQAIIDALDRLQQGS